MSNISELEKKIQSHYQRLAEEDIQRLRTYMRASKDFNMSGEPEIDISFGYPAVSNMTISGPLPDADDYRLTMSTKVDNLKNRKRIVLHVNGDFTTLTKKDNILMQMSVTLTSSLGSMNYSLPSLLKKKRVHVNKDKTSAQIILDEGMHWTGVRIFLLGFEICGSPAKVETEVLYEYSDCFTLDTPTSLAVENDCFIVTDAGCNSITKYNTKGEKVREIPNYTNIKQPCEILLVDSQIVVTSKNCVTFFEKDTLEVKQYFEGSYGGLVKDEQSCDVYSTLTSQTAGNIEFYIVKFTFDTTTKSYTSLGFKSNIKNVLDSPLEGAVVKFITKCNEKIIGTNFQTIFSTDLSTHITTKTRFEELDRPTGITAFRERVFCCDNLNHRILLFSKDLIFLRVVFVNYDFLYPNNVVVADTFLFITFQKRNDGQDETNGVVLKVPLISF